jgi:hypothetical protein
MDENKKIIGYKGFNRDLKCRDKQYAIGETFEEENIELCSRGLHFCESPLDVFDYYSSNNSRYCKIEAEDVSEKTDNDSKRVAKKITLKAEIGLHGLIKAGVEFAMSKVTWTKENSTTGDCSGASSTGDCSGASSTGDYSGASSTGYKSGASSTGNCSGASSTGYKSGASAGKGSVAMSVGMLSRAKGDVGAYIVLTECEEVSGEYFIKNVKCSRLDGKKIKANICYFLKNGKLVEADENDY